MKTVSSIYIIKKMIDPAAHKSHNLLPPRLDD